ncbi:MAG: immunity protein Imm33 domain-containing protein [Arenicella sp.]
MTDIETLLLTQKECCEFYDAVFSPINNEQLVVISDGVYEGDPVEGVRYQSPKHMTGWWVTTDRYNGDVDSLKTVHFSHIIEKRPDLAIYMALPSGYRFILGGADDSVWFDEVVAKEPS